MIVEAVLSSITSFLGLIFLWIKFGGKKSVKELRLEAEENSFTFEGKKVILFIVGMIMLASVLTALFMAIYVIIRDYNK